MTKENEALGAVGLAEEYAALVTFGGEIGTAHIPPEMSARVLVALARTPRAQVGAATDSGEGVVIDLDKSAFEQICQAAEESNWIPPEYFRNDWISDVCDFLRNGPASPTATVADSVEAERITKRLRRAREAMMDGRLPRYGQLLVAEQVMLDAEQALASMPAQSLHMRES